MEAFPVFVFPGGVRSADWDDEDTEVFLGESTWYMFGFAQAAGAAIFN